MMKRKQMLNLFLGLALVLGLLPVLAIAAPAAEAPLPSKIEQALLDTLSAEGTADFIVRFVEQADLDPAYGMGWHARGEFVYNTLQETAERSQINAKAYLDGQGLEYHTFVTGNDLYVWAGNLDAANALAALPEVDTIRATRVYQVPEPTPQPDATIVWGILDTAADQFWTAFGVQGNGIVVANIDTGVDYTHDALEPNYKCGAGPHGDCWLDPGTQDCSGPGGGPCDTIYAGIYHGTHTMGTMAADDDPGLLYTVGMAPDAQWIACLGCPFGSCPDFDLNSCADWMLQPGGNPDNRPHVVNNSWGGGGCDPWYLAKVTAWQAAGIFPAFSAGNSSGCSSMGSPGDYQESFASTGHNSSRIHSYAQGPSCYGHEPYTKPNVTAPAVGVMSTQPGNGWTSISGTSMASPHSAGAVALLWSCAPSLIGQIDLTFEALQNNADPPDPPDPACGAPPDGEGTYEDGYGYLNILAAGVAYCGGVATGWLDGFVYESAPPHNPIAGASVIAVPASEGGNQIEAITDPNGYYTMTLLVGTYDVTASKNGYAPQTVTGVEILDGQVTQQDFMLDFLGAWTEVSTPDPPPMQYNRFDGVFNPHDGLIYFLSGRTGASTHDRNIWTYDPATNTYVDTGYDMLYNISNFTIHLIEDDGTGRGEAMYVVGGYDAVAAANHDHVQRFYPQTGDVEEVVTDPYPDLAPNNLPVGAGGSATLNDKIYVFGGWDSALPYFSNRTWEFDPQAPAGSKWTEITSATLTPARAYINVAVQGDLIYAMGGIISYTGGDLIPTDVAEVFDPANPSAGWVALTSMPVATAEGRGFGFQADTLGLEQPAGKIYVAGGGDWPDQSAEVMEYDVATDIWDQTFPDLITARRDHAGAYVQTCTVDPTDGLPGMWVFGGRITGDDPPYGLPEFFPFPCPEQQASFTANPDEGCGPLEVQFTDTSNPTPEEWLWDFGDGTGTSTEQNPVHTYNAYGIFEVTLWVSSAIGTDWTTGTVTVDPLQAAFDADPAQGCGPLEVQFTDTSVCTATEWLWDFGDGVGTSTEQNPVYTYATAGEFEVTLWVTNEVSADWTTGTVTVDPLQAAFDADPAQGCGPLEVQFTDTSVCTATEWLWDFGDGIGTSTEQNPVYTYTTAGEFEVTLWVTNEVSADWTTGTIEVYATPEAAFTWSPTTIYTGTVVQFTDLSTGPVTDWLWETSDGYTYTEQNPTHTFLTAGTFTVTLTVTSDMDCTDELAQELEVLEEEEPPPPMFYLYLPIVVRH